MSDDWREALESRIRALKTDRQHILQLDWKLSSQQQVSEQDREAFNTAVRTINSEIARIELELIIDDILSGDFELMDSGTIIKKGP